jgi:hypothetical protein
MYELVTGAAGGLVAGAVMLAILAVAFPLLRLGQPLQPLYLFAAFSDPDWGRLSGFAASALVVGTIIHLVMSLGLGALFSWLVNRSTGRTLVISGVVWGLLVWAIQQFAILQVVDPLATRDLPLWLFAVAHTVYGLVLGWFVARVRAQGGAPRVEAPFVAPAARGIEVPLPLPAATPVRPIHGSNETAGHAA